MEKLKNFIEIIFKIFFIVITAGVAVIGYKEYKADKARERKREIERRHEERRRREEQRRAARA
jgi:transcriptional regulator of NAD metabolism